MKTAEQMTHSRHLIWKPSDLGDKAADVITGFVGSWPFVGIHAVWFVLWIVLRIEPFPFGLLTLLVSLEAIFLSTFVMMSQNRAAARDHIRDDHEAEEVDMLFKINQTQLEILELLRTASANQDNAKPLHLAETIRQSVPAATPKATTSRSTTSPGSGRRRGR
jgi:uncharacterized membrane protein